VCRYIAEKRATAWVGFAVHKRVESATIFVLVMDVPMCQ